MLKKPSQEGFFVPGYFTVGIQLGRSGVSAGGGIK
ncbi:hypothetical protein EC839_1267 [Pseudomonas sp. JUb52]|nr:hypothetical protein EC839_1267 [Pseudomonas sp. JUb52]